MMTNVDFEKKPVTPNSYDQYGYETLLNFWNNNQVIRLQGLA